jgi:hypothetical protein
MIRQGQNPVRDRLVSVNLPPTWAFDPTIGQNFYIFCAKYRIVLGQTAIPNPAIDGLRLHPTRSSSAG